MKKLLIDTNLISRALAPQENEKGKLQEEALEKLDRWDSDEQLRMGITPLIRFEVLCNPRLTEEQKSKIAEFLDGLEEFRVDKESAELAAHLFIHRKKRNGPKKPEKVQNTEKIHKDGPKFDLLHFAVAKTNQLEIESVDGDMDTIQSLYDDMKKSA